MPYLPEGRAYRFHTIVKPIGAACNLNCDYCFYLHKIELLEQPKYSAMSDEILEQHIKQYIEAQTGDEVIFSWQGGEPTLLGLDFFKKVVSLQEKYKKPKQNIENDLQTNGTLLTEEWAEFLHKHNFHVGLTIDGSEEFHNQFRVDKANRGTFHKVMNAANLLREHAIPFSALAVGNRYNSKKPVEVYRFLADKLGTYKVQFSPAVEPVNFKQKSPKVSVSKKIEPADLVTSWSVLPNDYGKFLCDIWDEWFANDYGRIQINFFETMVAQAMDMPA